jgi:hypothetical protein
VEDPSTSQNKVPLRFRIGMALIYLTLLMSFFSLNTSAGSQPLEEEAAPWLTLGSVVLCSALFVTAFGTARKGLIAFSVLVPLLLGGAVIYGELAFNHWLKPFIEPLVRDRTREALLEAAPYIALGLAFVVFVPLVEEAAKLVPLLLLCRWRRIPDMRSAMICGALAGMCFGVIEANVYAFIEYGPEKFEAGQWIIRYYGMCLTHGMWDALGGALMFCFLSRGSTGGGAIFKSWATVSIVHLAHNGLQAIIGPVTQIATMIGLLLPIYILARRAWREPPPASIERDLRSLYTGAEASA